MSSKQSPERGHARRATNEALATSPGQAPKRGRTTSGETASALGCAAQRTRPTRSGTRFLPEASCPAGGELLRMPAIPDRRSRRERTQAAATASQMSEASSRLFNTIVSCQRERTQRTLVGHEYRPRRPVVRAGYGNALPPVAPIRAWRRPATDGRSWGDVAPVGDRQARDGKHPPVTGVMLLRARGLH